MKFYVMLRGDEISVNEPYNAKLLSIVAFYRPDQFEIVIALFNHYPKRIVHVGEHVFLEVSVPKKAKNLLLRLKEMKRPISTAEIATFVAKPTTANLEHLINIHPLLEGGAAKKSGNTC
jgi:hypothetical protein